MRAAPLRLPVAKCAFVGIVLTTLNVVAQLFLSQWFHSGSDASEHLQPHEHSDEQVFRQMRKLQATVLAVEQRELSLESTVKALTRREGLLEEAMLRLSKPSPGTQLPKGRAENKTLSGIQEELSQELSLLKASLTNQQNSFAQQNKAVTKSIVRLTRESQDNRWTTQVDEGFEALGTRRLKVVC